MEKELGQASFKEKDKWNIKVEMKELITNCLSEEHNIEIKNDKNFVIHIHIENENDEIETYEPFKSRLQEIYKKRK